jgi:PTS system nitrogen regulatory IIA component
MKIIDLLSSERVVSGVQASSKKRLFELASEIIAKDCPDFGAAEVFEGLFARERLGSTGLGSGVAIPHGRIKGVRNAIGSFVQLKQAVDYDAIDGEPVDLLFCLLVPEESTDEHLQILSKLAELFSNKELCKRLRSADNDEVLLKLLTKSEKG